MNLNPFELRENDYYVKDMFTKGGYYLKANKFGEEYGSYEYLLKGINTEINWTVICYAGSYQGELYCLGELEGKVYYFNTGYGSCSGCDWYQANEDTIEGLQEVQDGIKREIREFDNLNDFMEWFSGEYNNSWGREERDEFLGEISKHYFK